MLHPLPFGGEQLDEVYVSVRAAGVAHWVIPLSAPGLGGVPREWTQPPGWGQSYREGLRRGKTSCMS